MSKWRLAKERGITFMDITAMTGVKAFAPDFAEVKKYKRGETSDEDYTKLYLDRMARSKVVCPKLWAGLDRRYEIVIACYCKAGAFCHRHLFVALMKEQLEQQGHEVILEGEME